MNNSLREPIATNKTRIAIALLFALTFVVSGCVSTPAYDQTEYDRVITLKVDAVNLLQKASEDFQTHKTEVNNIKHEMSVLYEYAKNLPNNEEEIKMIQIMNNSDGTLLGKALADWEKKGTFSQSYSEGLISNISDGFDQISGLISHRIKK
jgi:hypothetical protein